MAGPLRSTRVTGLHHYYGTVRHCMPRHGTLPLPHFLGWGSPSRSRGGRRPLLPPFRGRSFPRSALAPRSDSRRLYAGCRPSSKQVSLGLVAGLMSDPFSTSFKVLLDALPAVHSFVRLSDPDLTISRIAFSVTFTTPAVVPAQLTAVCSLPLRERLRRAYLHHQRSTALVLRYLHGFTSTFVAQTLFEPACRVRHERPRRDPPPTFSGAVHLRCRPAPGLIADLE
jgi:hypothetical protein